MKTFTITKTMADLIREGASKTRGATAAKKKSAEEIAAQGARGYFFSNAGVKDGHISAETLSGIRELIASGLLTKGEYALWSMAPKEAEQKGLSKERNALTSSVNAYLGSFRAMIETAWRNINPEAAKAEAAAAKAKAEATGAEATGAEATDIRKALKNLMLDVSALPECPNRAKILLHLNYADEFMAKGL